MNQCRYVCLYINQCTKRSTYINKLQFFILFKNKNNKVLDNKNVSFVHNLIGTVMEQEVLKC